MGHRGFQTKIWNEETDAILREMFPTYPMEDIALRIGCSDTAVSYRARKLGLKRSPDYNQYAFGGDILIKVDLRNRLCRFQRKNYDRRTKQRNTPAGQQRREAIAT